MNLDEETQDLVLKVGGGNPGALRIAMDMLGKDCLIGRMAIESAINADIVREELWLLYKDVHKCDLVATREALILGQALSQLEATRGSKHFQATPR